MPSEDTFDERVEDEERICRELEQIRLFLSEVTGLASNWTGRVRLIPEAGFKGQKPFDCDILLDAALASQETRWRTLLHESLHAASAGYNRDDFESFRGWEEGAVEKLQRLLRPAMLARLNLRIAEQVFRRAEEGHLYTPYLTALEAIQQHSQIQEHDFYVTLLKTPIKERPVWALGLASQMPREKRHAFLTTFSKSNSVLKEVARWNLLKIKGNTANGSSA